MRMFNVTLHFKHGVSKVYPVKAVNPAEALTKVVENNFYDWKMISTIKITVGELIT